MKYLRLIALFSLLLGCVPKGKVANDEKTQKAEPRQDVAMARTPVASSPAVNSSVFLSLKMEDSYPVDQEVIVHIAGNLPNPCSKLKLEVTRTNESIEIHAKIEPPADGSFCIQVLSEVNEPVSLGLVPASERPKRIELWVDGNEIEKERKDLK
jgi:hypothetical protein